MDKKTLLITVGSVIAIIAFLFGAYAMTNKPEVTEVPAMKNVKATDHMKWSSAKKVVLVEYSDFQCPACQVYHQLLSEIGKDKSISDNVTLVYRHFPLDSIHPNARNGSHAAEAASQQNKFFEMHDILFERQEEWSTADKPIDKFKEYAKELKLDVAKFEKDFSSQTAKQRVQNDFLEGSESGVQGTPTFYLNGAKIANPQSVEAFKQILTEAIKATQ